MLAWEFIEWTSYNGSVKIEAHLAFFIAMLIVFSSGSVVFLLAHTR